MVESPLKHLPGNMGSTFPFRPRRAGNGLLRRIPSIPSTFSRTMARCVPENQSYGITGVSFYTDWGLLEGNPGHIYTEGVWSLDLFFASASEAGIYLIARPGPVS